MRWKVYSDYLRKRFGMSVFRIGVDASFSCPNRTKERMGGCAFCDGTGAVAVYQRSGEGGFHHDAEYNRAVAESKVGYHQDIREQIIKGKEFLRRRYGAEAYSIYFQSFSNTYAPVFKLKEVYDEALKEGPFKELIISTRPDCLDDEKLSLISSYKEKGLDVEIELGLQSANDDTLRYINRGHDVACYINAARKVKEYGLFLSTHVILGLPGETDDDFKRTANVVNAYSDAVKIHNLDIAGGTRFQYEYEHGMIRLLTLDEYIQAVELFIARLRPDIIIQRLISETPSHRLIAPRDFPDKSKFIRLLDAKMEADGLMEGSLYEKT